MKIQDRIYGEVEITEPVLQELIETPAITRLKGINQFGMPQRYYPYPGFNRYEHSLGVMLVLRKLGADVEEQAAGLIHDVSHTAFSHIVDWVIGNQQKEDHQDNNLKRIVYSSKIPKILKRNGFDTKNVTNINRYGLLERPAPFLCADRVDYALREFNTWANPSIVTRCIDDLVVMECDVAVRQNHQIAFKTKKSAEDFAYTYAKCQKEHWAGAQCVVRWELLARALKIGIKEGFVNVDDFYSEDEDVIRKLINSGNQEVLLLISKLERPKLNLKENRNNPQFNIRKKYRFIDPYYFEDGKILLLGESDPLYAKFLEEQRKINEKGIKVDLVD